MLYGIYDHETEECILHYETKGGNQRKALFRTYSRADRIAERMNDLNPNWVGKFKAMTFADEEKMSKLADDLITIIANKIIEIEKPVRNCDYWEKEAVLADIKTKELEWAKKEAKRIFGGI